MTDQPSEISEADLVAYADGRLDPDRAAAVAAFLAENDAARRRVEKWQEQASLLKSALDPVAEEPVPGRLRQPLTPKRRRLWPMAAALAGIALGFSGGFLVWGEAATPQERDLASIGLSAHEVYSAEVRHPIEVTVADEDHLIAWLSNRLDFSITPPDLSASGLSLLGGRVVPQDGRPAAMLMYEDNAGVRYTLLIAHAEADRSTSFRYAAAAGAGAYYWMDGSVGYVLSGPPDRDRLLSLCRAVYDQLE